MHSHSSLSVRHVQHPLRPLPLEGGGRCSLPRRGDPAAPTASAGSADDLAAANMLQLAQWHNRNGNKPEAARCLRATIERYPAGATATTARTALGKQR